MRYFKSAPRSILSMRARKAAVERQDVVLLSVTMIGDDTLMLNESRSR